MHHRIGLLVSVAQCQHGGTAEAKFFQLQDAVYLLGIEAPIQGVELATPSYSQPPLLSQSLLGHLQWLTNVRFSKHLNQVVFLPFLEWDLHDNCVNFPSVPSSPLINAFGDFYNPILIST